METRVELQEMLEDLLGSHNVYFQPPESVRMKYPAIVYSRYDIDTRHADNKPYAQSLAYQLIVIGKNPDSDIVLKVSGLPMCSFDRHFTADNLNHDVFTLYY